MSRLAAFLKKNWFSISIPTVVGLDYLNPDVCRKGGYLGLDRHKDTIVMGMFLCSGASMPHPSVFRSAMAAHGVTRHVLIQGSSLIAFPMLAALFVPRLIDLSGLPHGCSVGLCFTTTLPQPAGVAIAMTRAAGGDSLLATLHTAIGNSVGPLAIPVTATSLAGVPADIETGQMLRSVVKLILVPLFIGIGARQAIPKVLGTGPMSKRLVISQQLLVVAMLAHVYANAFAVPPPGSPEAAKYEKKVKIDNVMLAKLCMVVAATYTSYFLLNAAVFARVVPASIMGGNEGAICGAYCSSLKAVGTGVPILDMMFGHRDDIDLMLTPLMLYDFYQIMFGSIAAPVILRAICKKRL